MDSRAAPRSLRDPQGLQGKMQGQKMSLPRAHTVSPKQLKNAGFMGRCFWWWWNTPLVQDGRFQRQVGLCDFETSLVYRTTFRTAKDRVVEPHAREEK